MNPPSFPPPPLPPGVPPPMPPPPLPLPPGMPLPPLPPNNNNGTTSSAVASTTTNTSTLLPSSEPTLNMHPQNSAQVILLTNLPPFLRSIRSIREAAFPACGTTARTVHLGCCVPKSKESEDWRKMKERGLLGLITNHENSNNVNNTDIEKQVMEALNWNGPRGGVAVVKMNHYIGAKNFAGGLLELRNCSLKNEGKGTLPSIITNKVEIKEANDSTGTTAEDSAADASNDKATDATTQEKEAAVAQEESNTASNDQKTAATTQQVKAPEYTKEEETKHLTTLQQLQNMHIYHLSNYHIPDLPNIPPDMIIPQPDPVPQDPTISFRLLESLTTLRSRYEEGGTTNTLSSGGTDQQRSTDDQWGGHAAAATGDAPDNNHGLKLDKDKIAAAAGGGAYDEDADPLNAPDVVNAVLEFKRKLETRDVTSRRRRVDIITDRMSRRVRELVEQGRNEKRRRQEMEQLQQQQQQLTQSSATVATASVTDSGRRGVSNLPAWMTKANEESVATTSASETKLQDDEEGSTRKRKFVPSEANRDINVRKQRLEVEGGQSLSEIRAANEAADKQAATVEIAESFVVQTTKDGILSSGSKFPPLPNNIDPLKAYVTAQIVDYLGEEEKTLIDFIMKELSKDGGGSTNSLLDEMKMVLDEDAEDFVVNLYRKMVQ